MRAIILAESSQCDLSPLTNTIPHALLPLAGKSILDHSLESLHGCSIRHVEVVAPTVHRELEASIEKDLLLGMNVRFAPRMLDLRHLPEHCLIVGLRDLADVDWDEIFVQFGDLTCHARIPIKMMYGGLAVALLVPPRFDGNVSCDWFDLYHTEAVQIPINLENLIETASICAYQQANFEMLQGKFKNLKAAGREFTSGHRRAPMTHINERSIQSDHGYFGSHSRVDKSATLCGTVILGDNVIVDKGARVSNSIIFDNTYVGANTDCTDSIINGNLMIRVDTGICLKLNDPVLFGAIA